jgi:hypothetical protein
MDKKIIICGCTKNSGSYLQSRIDLLHQIGTQFLKYNILIYENDSTDNTVYILNRNKSSAFDFITETNVLNKIQYPTLNQRVQILAHGRNTLLNVVKTKYASYDLMIMIDLDNVLENFNPKTILNAFKYGDDWAALTANCIGKYYDIWALRIHSNIWNPVIHNLLWTEPLEHDCWFQIKNNIHPQICIKSYQSIIPIKMPLIPTTSSFGGLGIYKIKNIMNSSYKCFNNSFIECEHISFHKSISGKMYICPSLLVHSPTEHIV